MTSSKDPFKASYGAHLPLKKKALSAAISTLMVAGFVLSVPMVSAQDVQADTNKPINAADKKAGTPAKKAAQTNANGSEIEEMVVTGIRASQRDAIDLKKMAGTMADSIIAEDVSKFPDKNVTEALQRIPGVQITRDFGEGSGINIRGMEAGLNRIEFDGVSALGTGGRDVNLTGTSSELVKVATVVKGSEARITEGGIGGTIQIEMRKPNDFKENFFSVTAEEQYNDLSLDYSPKINLTGVYKINDDMGIMLNYNAEDKHTMIHALRNTEWRRWADYDHSAEKTVSQADYDFAQSADDCTDAYGPNGTAELPVYANGNRNTALNDCRAQWYEFGPYLPRYGIWERQEKRTSYNLGYGWQVSDELSVFSDYTFTERSKHARDYNLQFGTGWAGGMDPDSVVVDENHNIRAFTSANAEVTNRTLDFNWLQQMDMFKLGADFSNGKFDIKSIVSISRSKEDIDSRDTHITSTGVAGVDVRLDSQGAPEFDLTSGYRYQDPDSDDVGEFEIFNVNDPNSYNARARYKYNPILSDQNEDSAKVDFNYHFDDGKFITTARAGARWSLRSLEAKTFTNNIIRDVGTSYNLLDWQGNPVMVDLDGDGTTEQLMIEWTREDQAALISGAMRTTPDFFPGIDLGVGTLENYQAVDTDTLVERLERIGATSVDRDNLQPDRGAYYIEEQTYAGYLQLDFSQEIGEMRFWGNAGLRYIRTDTVAEGDVRINTIYDTYVKDPDNPDDPYASLDGKAFTWDLDANGVWDRNAVLDYNGDGLTNQDDRALVYNTTDGVYNPTKTILTFAGRDSSKGSYDDVLPSININLSIIPDVLNVYAGWSKVMSRPAITALNVNATCTRYATWASLYDEERRLDLNNTCGAGNPDLQPYRATQTDLAVMWYPNADTMISGSYFTKALTSYLGENVTYYDKDFFAGGENGGVIYDVTQPTNISGVTTHGVELQARTVFTMLPEPYNGIGIDVNYTRMGAEDVPYTSQLDGSDLSLLGQSKNSYNLTAFYEDENWTLRMAYNYRDTYLVNTADRGGNPVYVEGSGQLDGKLSYTFSDIGITLYADVRNLLGEVKHETAGKNRLTDLQWAGRTYSFGLNYKM